ncbi:NAD(P)/FAD-dependent oxidoreductase [Actinomadura decatromicini]|uniref:FAD-dependent oxidoreductase n=1 Tax=Actinomadura decatromicini TaxID=2604572 RepID=A0A5D3FYR3_9ACTN|nr:FAD-dependent oxidoreductase [Actinomadura decatromicini]TYK53158.1 FAD-dependent oxidoreductase [Actinomadura decatromicini]
MAKIVVIGAGMAGLAVALFCARRGHMVTVVERDDQPKPEASAEEDFTEWERDGVPHARQGHNFLGLSSRIMREEAPDVLDAVAARGAPRVPIAGGDGDENVLSRRLVYEGALRRVVEAQPGVEVLSGTSVKGLLTRGELAGVPRVVGVRLPSGEVAADVVVDASGRRTRSVRWLAEAGCRPPRETAQPCGFHYLTQHFRLRPGQSFPALTVPIYVKLDYTKLVLFAGDNGCFQVSMTVAADDPLRHRLREPGVYHRFLESVPLTAPWLDRSEPIDEPHPMGNLEDRWRRLVIGGRPVVAGLVLLGDSALQTNPAFGRGVPLAFLQARHFADTVETAGDAAGFVARFDEWAERNLGFWFRAQVASSREQREHIEAGVRGRPIAPPADPMGRFIAALAIVSEDEPEVNAVQLRFFNMLMTPEALVDDPVAAPRIRDYLETHADPVVPAQGPDRTEFERLVAR